MKKVLSVIMVVLILISSAFCLNVFASDKPMTDELLEEIEQSKELSVVFRPGESTLFGFIKTETVNTVMVSGNKIAYLCDAGSIQIKVVSDNKGGIYAFFPQFPYVYVKLDTIPIIGTDIWEILKGATTITGASIEYKETSTETVDGIEYVVEVYDDKADVESRFYYQDSTLKMLKVENTKTHTVQVTHFEEINLEADEDFFDVPKFAVDVTPLLKGLFVMLIGALGNVTV